MAEVDLGREVLPSVLEEALKKGAEQIGWHVGGKSEDISERSYKFSRDLLLPVESIDTYQYTQFELWDRQIHKLTLSFYRDRKQSSFSFLSGFHSSLGVGDATEDEVRSYLTAVSNNLPLNLPLR